MKKYIVLILISQINFAQSIFPTDGSNVGIGTTNPSQKLEVNGNAIFKGGIISDVSAAIGGYVKIINSSKTTNGSAKDWTIFNMGGVYGNSLQFWAYDNLGCGTGLCSNRFTIMDNGNIGIGTNLPAASLEIKTPAITGSETLLKLGVSDAAQDYIRIANGTNADNQFIPSLQGYRVSDNRASLYISAITEPNIDSGVDPLMTFDSRTSAAAIITRPLFAWDSYGNRKMTLTANGGLGIGTLTTGTHKLAVEGSIGAREIKVMATGWSDFVFKKDYQLPTLEQVEKHIIEKGHLENIPSEEEVLKNGINLGEMNSKLLQKIEELTLYTIEQQKELNSVKAKLERIENLLSEKLENK